MQFISLLDISYIVIKGERLQTRRPLQFLETGHTVFSQPLTRMKLRNFLLYIYRFFIRFVSRVMLFYTKNKLSLSLSSHITSIGSSVPFPTSVHLLQTKCFAELQVGFFNFVHLPCIRFIHCVQHTALDPTLFLHILQESILLKTISPSVPLTIILVFPTFRFNPLSSNALLHF